MIDSFKKALLAGIGLASVTKEKLEEIADKLIEEGKMSKEEAEKFLDELIKKSEEARNEFDIRIEKTVKHMFNRFDVAYKEDIEALQKRIDELEQKLKS